MTMAAANLGAVSLNTGLAAAYVKPSSHEYPSSLPNLSMQCIEPPHLKYNISEIDGGVMLSIWEPAPKNDVRVKPFLFMSRHRLPSELEAKKLLAHYLSVYRQAARQSL